MRARWHVAAPAPAAPGRQRQDGEEGGVQLGQLQPAREQDHLHLPVLEVTRTADILHDAPININ